MDRTFIAHLDDKWETCLTLGPAGNGVINIPNYKPYGNFNLVMSASGVTYDTEIMLYQMGNTPLSTLQYHPQTAATRKSKTPKPQEIKFLDPDIGQVIPADDENLFVCFPAFDLGGRFPITLALNILREDKKITITIRYPLV